MVEFRFFCQRIKNTKNSNDKSYELLLRSADGASFPAEEFSKIVVNKEKHKEYLIWLEEAIKSVVERYPNKIFSFNLDHQELEYDDTFNMLKKLSKFKNRVIIEVTEVPPTLRNTSYYSHVNLSAFQKIKNMGYRIALDDVAEGINSIGNLFLLLDFIDRVKFSTLSFKCSMNEDQLKKFIVYISNIAKFAKKDLVIEGIEDDLFSQWVSENITHLHQGYIYSKPHNIWPVELKKL